MLCLPARPPGRASRSTRIASSQRCTSGPPLAAGAPPERGRGRQFKVLTPSWDECFPHRAPWLERADVNVDRAFLLEAYSHPAAVQSYSRAVSQIGLWKFEETFLSRSLRTDGRILDLDDPPPGLPPRNPFRRIRAPQFDRSVGKTPCPGPDEVQRLLLAIGSRSPRRLCLWTPSRSQ
jgi:hypothetical protein